MIKISWIFGLIKLNLTLKIWNPHRNLSQNEYPHQYICKNCRISILRYESVFINRKSNIIYLKTKKQHKIWIYHAFFMKNEYPQCHNDSEFEIIVLIWKSSYSEPPRGISGEKSSGFFAELWKLDLKICKNRYWNLIWLNFDKVLHC